MKAEMKKPSIEFTLLPASDEPDTNAQSYSSTDESARLRLSLSDELNLDPLNLGSLPLAVAAALGPTLGAALGAWLHARYGRKVRLKIGEIEAEAQTPEEVEKLIAEALVIQERNAPKIIQEP